MESYADPKIGGSRAEGKFQLFGEVIKHLQAILSKGRHDDRVVWSRFRQTGHRNV
jgi:hypothetical protein